MAYINKKQILLKLDREGDKVLKQELRSRIRPVYDRARKEILENFDSHPVTREIAAGPRGSGEVMGEYGNLYSFIGFMEGRDPVQELREIIRRSLRGPTFRKVKKGGRHYYRMTILYPTNEFLEEHPATSVGRSYTGRSWLNIVRKGLAGYGNYLYDPTRNFNSSASGSAIQIKVKIRQGRVKPVAYMNPIINEFISTISRGVRGAL